jgi:hypothetical protein
MNFGAVVVVVVVDVDDEVVEVVEGADDDGATDCFPPDELQATTAARTQTSARRTARLCNVRATRRFQP